eukprot:432683-Hanusia_phi.AAC.1
MTWTGPSPRECSIGPLPSVCTDAGSYSPILVPGRDPAGGAATEPGPPSLGSGFIIVSNRLSLSSEARRGRGSVRRSLAVRRGVRQTQSVERMVTRRGATAAQSPAPAGRARPGQAAVGLPP